MENNVHSVRNPTYNVRPLGDRALVIGLKEDGAAPCEPLWKLAAELAQHLRSHNLPWIVDVIPAYDTVTLVYDPLLVSGRDGALRFSDARYNNALRHNEVLWDNKARRLNEALRLNNALRSEDEPLPYDYVAASVPTLLAAPAASAENDARLVEIPVCYGGAYGPDLAACAARSGLAEAEFIAMHAQMDYKVAMIGFMPGFPYLTGLSEALAQPRRPSPRSRVPAGSVGIAGGQTGIYPLASPGGWQLIGRTPLRLFDPGRGEPALLRAGDVLRFVPVTAADERLREMAP